MKLLGSIWLVCAFTFSLSAQTRFNVREIANQNAVYFTGVIEELDGYVVIGNSLNPTDTGVYQSIVWTKFNFDGEFLEEKAVNRDEGYFLHNTHIGIKNLNVNFNRSCVGYMVSSEETNLGYILNYNSIGDTTQVFSFESPYFSQTGDQSIAPVEFCGSTNDDNSIFISTNILNTESGTGGDFYIQRMTPNGETLWEYIYATEAQPEHCNALLPTENGGVLGVVRMFGEYGNFLELDSNGVEITNVPNTIYNTVGGLVWYDNEHFIGAGNGLGEDNFITGRVFMMNRSGEVLWDNIIGNGYAQTFQNQFYALVESTDSSGFVAGGTKKEFHLEEEQTDTIGTTISQGWLVKVNEDGEILWDRTYHYIDTPNEEHTLNDLKATNDGGYIFCGESRDLDSGQPFSEGPPQQGWLVKVDEHGCLVEGCHLSDDINVIEQEGSKKYFKAGPNPADQFLNVYQSYNAPQGATYQLINSKGGILKDFPAMKKGTTTMLDISTFSSGMYHLVLKEGNKLVQSQKILIH